MMRKENKLQAFNIEAFSLLALPRVTRWIASCQTHTPSLSLPRAKSLAASSALNHPAPAFILWDWPWLELQLWLLPPCCQLPLGIVTTGWVERVPGVAVCGGMCGVASPALCSPRTGCSNLVMLLHCSRRSALQRNVPANLIVDTDSADLQISKFLSWPRIMTGGFYANFLAPSMRLLLGLHKQPPTKICNLVSC